LVEGGDETRVVPQSFELVRVHGMFAFGSGRGPGGYRDDGTLVL